MQYWLLKSEPSSWSWQNQLDRGDTGEGWDGVRNHQASNNMKAMQIGDLAFFYHSVNEKQIVGIAEVREVFKSPKFGQVAGCLVVEGTIFRSKPIRVLRDNVVIFEGELESLRRFKDDANEVRSGLECGIGVRNYDVKVGDKIEVFDTKAVARSL